MRLTLFILIAAICALVVSPPVIAEDVGADSAVVDSVPAAPVPETDLERSQRLLGELEFLQNKIEEEVAAARRLEGQERQLKRVQLLALAADMDEVADDLAHTIPNLDSLVVDSLRVVAEPALRYPPDLYLRAVYDVADRLTRMRDEREKVDVQGLQATELRIRDYHERIDTFMEAAINSAKRLERIGIDASDVWKKIDDALVRRGESLSARIQVNALERDRLEDEVKDTALAGGDNQTNQLRLQAIRQRVNALLNSLKITADLMDSRGLNAADHGRLIIKVTGSITEDILNPEVVRGLIKDFYRGLVRWMKHKGPAFVVRAGILILAILVTQLVFWLGWFVVVMIARPPLLLRNLLRGLLRPSANFIGLFVGLWFLGVNPATLLAGVGVLSVIVGLALQDSLGNLAAGMFILLYRPYDVDNIVQAGGVIGRVKEMGLANTTIITFDRRRLFVPNRKIWSEVIENRSAEPLRRIQATVRIRYDEDIDGTIDYLKGAMKEHDLVVDDPATEVFVSKLDDSWVEISVWPWTRADHWWTMETTLAKVLRLALDQRGIEHPLPRHEIDLHQRPDPETDNPS